MQLRQFAKKMPTAEQRIYSYGQSCFTKLLKKMKVQPGAQTILDKVMPIQPFALHRKKKLARRNRSRVDRIAVSDVVRREIARR